MHLKFVFCGFLFRFSLSFEILEQRDQLVFNSLRFGLQYIPLVLSVNNLNFFRGKENIGKSIIADDATLFHVFSLFEQSINHGEWSPQEIFVRNNIDNLKGIREWLGQDVGEEKDRVGENMRILANEYNFFFKHHQG